LEGTNTVGIGTDNIKIIVHEVKTITRAGKDNTKPK
jgi:hypothetical protein